MSTLQASNALQWLRRCVCIAAGAWLSIACTALIAAAQDTDASTAKQADALIAEGLALREQGADDEALQRFETAYDLSLSPRALAQRGWAEQALGRWASAEAHLQEAKTYDQDAWIVQHRSTLEQTLAVIAARLTDLRVYGGVTGAELRLNGKLLTTLPLTAALRVEAGKAMLEVSLDGYYPVQREITLPAGGLATESIELVPVKRSGPLSLQDTDDTDPSTEGDLARHASSAQQPTAAAADADTASGLPSWVFWAAGTTTLVLGGFAIGSALDTRQQRDHYVAYATSSAAQYEAAKQRFDSADEAQTRTNLLIAATAVSAVGTAVLGVFFTKWEPREYARAASGKHPVRVAVAGPGLRIDGSF